MMRDRAATKIKEAQLCWRKMKAFDYVRIGRVAVIGQPGRGIPARKSACGTRSGLMRMPSLKGW
jgi:hypothetical protein